jgi:hypothetical protein
MIEGENAVKSSALKSSFQLLPTLSTILGMKHVLAAMGIICTKVSQLEEKMG